MSGTLRFITNPSFVIVEFDKSKRSLTEYIWTSPFKFSVVNLVPSFFQMEKTAERSGARGEVFLNGDWCCNDSLFGVMVK